ncbi:hypothetical protein [Nonomuraea turcica]|uniref:hypothetical protein n=1 Tax=Nonomuraea sp. G32 TaxID=3067274 RepID=UPI00273AD877|nr:hypothetical protein [Nonomuraea sp. G32]MDP4511927.1 hypothetical protein [Nonomuraea sp. G32]
MRLLTHGRRLAAIIVVAFAVVLAMVAWNHLAGPWASVSSSDMRRVLLNAIAISHPEYHVAFDQISDEQLTVPADGGNIPIKISPLSPWPVGGFPIPVMTTLELRADGSIGLLNASGNGRVPEALKRITSGPSGFPEDVDDKAVVADLDGAILVQAVITLKSPLTEQTIRGFTPNAIDTIFVGERSREPIIAWPNGTCESRGITGCSEQTTTPLVHQFQKWVSQLGAEDDALLSRVGLGAQDLRERAAGGLAWGYIVSLHPAELRSLAADSRVAGCTLVGVELDT